jgi:hypothetical protein
MKYAMKDTFEVPALIGVHWLVQIPAATLKNTDLTDITTADLTAGKKVTHLAHRERSMLFYAQT